MTVFKWPPAPHPVRNEPYKSSGEDYVIIGVEGQMTDTKMIFHATGETTGGACVLYEIHWRPNDASAHHLHTLEDEGFYVLKGRLTLHTPDGEIVLGPGEFGWAPRGIRHGYTAGPEGARVLLVQTPGTGLPDAFRAIASATAAGVNPFESEETFEAFNKWVETNFGATFFDPVAYPPGQTVLDPAPDDVAPAAD